MSDRNQTRRRLLEAAGTGLGLVLAGCAGGATDQAGTSAPATTRTRTETTTATSTETRTAGGETTDPETTTAEPAVEDEPGPPGYKHDHWHGQLFFEVNGELVDFHQPKYYLKNIEAEHPEAVLFHFHDGSHGPWEWSNEKQQITFARALNLLPGIGYRRKGSADVVEYDGTTYDGSASGTHVSVHQATKRIDPTSHTVHHDDVFYVQAITGDRKRTVEPAHDGARLGTLIVDVNNRRLDFSDDRYVQAGTKAFHFHDDGHPNLWYEEGDPVTLQAALDTLPDLTYRQNGAGHVVEYESGDRYAGTYEEGNDADRITIRQRFTDVDPTTYTLQAGDVIWVYVHTTRAPDNEH